MEVIWFKVHTLSGVKDLGHIGDVDLDSIESK